eukprot:6842986-Pyramimonas_sp.AAC.1
MGGTDVDICGCNLRVGGFRALESGRGGYAHAGRSVRTSRPRCADCARHTPYHQPKVSAYKTASVAAIGRRPESTYSHDGPIRRTKHGYIRTMDQSDAQSTGIFARWTYQTQEATRIGIAKARQAHLRHAALHLRHTCSTSAPGL